MIIKKDKITKQIEKVIEQIEKEEFTFEDKQKLLLNEYKEIYTSDNLTFDDLIKRKVYLNRSKKIYNIVFLGMMLSIYVTFLSNIYSNAINNITSNKYLISLGEFGLSLLTLILIYLFAYNEPIKPNNIEKYNTEKFEIELIDTIIENKFNFDCVKNEIINSYLNED